MKYLLILIVLIGLIRCSSFNCTTDQHFPIEDVDEEINNWSTRSCARPLNPSTEISMLRTKLFQRCSRNHDCTRQHSEAARKSKHSSPNEEGLALKRPHNAITSGRAPFPVIEPARQLNARLVLNPALIGLGRGELNHVGSRQPKRSHKEQQSVHCDLVKLDVNPVSNEEEDVGGHFGEWEREWLLWATWGEIC